MKLYKLEAVRGFAAVYVVLHHTLPHYFVFKGVNIGNVFRFGQEAVILFFLLSGFVINYSWQKSENKTFGSYFSKRFFRIYIPLFIVLFLGWVVESAKVGVLVDLEIKNLLLNIFMLQDVGALKPNVIVEPYMHNNPLWSLSYEWWFYMMYYPINKYIKSAQNQSNFVYIISIISSLIYIFDPQFLSRLLMYFCIWWSGVYLSNVYIAKQKMSFINLKKPIIALMIVSLILILNGYSYFQSHSNIKIGLHPILEARHLVFSLSVIIFSILWRKFNWFGFDFIFKPFLFLAPISYVIYISHYYFITSGTYLNFIGNAYIEYCSYIICLLMFSFLIEMKVYPFLRKKLITIGKG